MSFTNFGWLFSQPRLPWGDLQVPVCCQRKVQSCSTWIFCIRKPGQDGLLQSGLGFTHTGLDLNDCISAFQAPEGEELRGTAELFEL